MSKLKTSDNFSQREMKIAVYWPKIIGKKSKVRMKKKYLETFMDTSCKNKYLEISRMLSPTDMHTMELSRTSYLVT